MTLIRLLLSLILLASFAQAGANLVLLPSALTPNTTGVYGDYAPGFGVGSWEASATANGQKSEFYTTPMSLFGSAFTIGDIASMSYWTKKPGGADSADWSLYLYTVKAASDNAGSWYQSRLTAEPYFSANNAGAAGQWNQWSTEAGPNELRFYEVRSNTAGTYLDPFLSTLTSGPVTWANGVTRDYTSEPVMYVSFQTGSGWANGFTGQLDGFRITLKNGDTATINFTAAPEPGTLALLGVPLIALGILRRYRR